MRVRAEKSGNLLENTLRHLHLLPGADSGSHCQRPEKKEGDSACSSFINPSPGTNSHVHRVLNLMKNNVKCCRHSNKFVPTANLFDLKQSAAIFGLKLLTLKTLSRKPTLVTFYEIIKYGIMN